MPPRSAKKPPPKKPVPTRPRKAEAPAEPESTIPDVPVEDIPEVKAPAAEDVPEETVQKIEEPVALPEEVKEAEDEEEEDDMEDAEEDDEGDAEEVAGENDASDNGDNSEGDDEEQESEEGGTEEENVIADKEDPSLYMHTPSEESRKRKESEVFVGGLNSKATEDDLIKAFSACGEVQLARIARNPVSNRSKGFGFVQFANAEQAKKAVAESKNGIEVEGKVVTVSPSTANDTLQLGNICKTWTADQVKETLKGLGLEHNFEVLLPNDPTNEGNSKGFAFLEFSNHIDAMAAFECLKTSGACFGRDKFAKVTFARSARHLDEEALSQVKTVYVEALPPSWDEDKIRELCEQYGEIERIELSKNFSRKRKRYFGFVAFTSRESAEACVEGLNSAQLGEGETKVSANIAKSEKKRRTSKVSDGVEVEKDGKKSSEATNAKKSTESLKRSKASKQKDTGKNVAGRKNGGPGQKTPVFSGVKKRKFKIGKTDFGERSQKRQHKDHGFGNARGRRSRNAPRGAGYSGHSSDLEPHAGLLSAGGRGHLAARSQGQHDAFVFGGGVAAPYDYGGYAHYPGYQTIYPYASGARHLPPRRAYY